MKAKDLMIGDWVNYHDDDKIVPKQVSEITNYKQLQLNDKNNWIIVGEKYLEPIPLTAEILEKNGFTCDANGMNDSDEPVVSVEYGEFQRNTDDGFKMLADGKAIKYVHELQHALKLCGIEKEIEL